MLESYYKLQMMSTTIANYKDALQLIWSTLPEKKTIENAVKDKDYRK